PADRGDEPAHDRGRAARAPGAAGAERGGAGDARRGAVRRAAGVLRRALRGDANLSAGAPGERDDAGRALHRGASRHDDRHRARSRGHDRRAGQHRHPEERAMTVDPTTLAVVKGWLEQIADEMDTVLARSAISTVISEQYDRACGLFEAGDGGTIVQGKTGLPVFVGSMQFAVQSVIRWAAERDNRPGDVWMLNDPYLAGTHLHDFKLVQPFYWDGELALYLASTGHWMDVGSSHPGGWNPKATEILQE